MALSKFGREERNRIIAAFERLGIPREKWLPLVGPEPPQIYQSLRSLEKFTPPAFNSYEQTEEEWIALADEAWRKFRDNLVQRQRLARQLGVDEVLKPKRRRGQGKTARNARVEDGYEWAALRLMGMQWKEIAAKYQSEVDPITAADRVRKTACQGRSNTRPPGRRESRPVPGCLGALV